MLFFENLCEGISLIFATNGVQHDEQILLVLAINLAFVFSKLRALFTFPGWRVQRIKLFLRQLWFFHHRFLRLTSVIMESIRPQVRFRQFGQLIAGLFKRFKSGSDFFLLVGKLLAIVSDLFKHCELQSFVIGDLGPFCLCELLSLEALALTRLLSHWYSCLS